MVWDESMGAEPGFFDVDHRMKRLSDLGDQLEAFGSAVDFEIFRGDLVMALAYSENGQGGRPQIEKSARVSSMCSPHKKERMDLFIRTIGIARATTKIGMAN